MVSLPLKSGGQNNISFLHVHKPKPPKLLIVTRSHWTEDLHTHMATLGIYVATYRDIAGVQMRSTVHPKWVAAMRALLGLICFILRPSNWGRPKQAAWVPRKCVE